MRSTPEGLYNITSASRHRISLDTNTASNVAKHIRDSTKRQPASELSESRGREDRRCRQILLEVHLPQFWQDHRGHPIVLDVRLDQHVPLAGEPERHPCRILDDESLCLMIQSDSLRRVGLDAGIFQHRIDQRVRAARRHPIGTRIRSQRA